MRPVSPVELDEQQITIRNLQAPRKSNPFSFKSPMVSTKKLGGAIIISMLIIMSIALVAMFLYYEEKIDILQKSTVQKQKIDVSQIQVPKGDEHQNIIKLLKDQMKQKDRTTNILITQNKALVAKLQQLIQNQQAQQTNIPPTPSPNKKQFLNSNPLKTAAPIDISKKENYQRVAEYLYKSPKIIQQRKKYHQERIRFITQKSNNPQIWLAKYNLKLNGDNDEQEQKDLQRDYLRLEEKFKLKEISTELPMCVIIPSYNNNNNFRLQYNMNSVFSQNYTNFQAVIMDDASSDGSQAVIRAYRDFYNISADIGIFVFNEKRVTAMANIYAAATKYCKPDAIGLNLDGDDEILGRNTLKVFNAVYQRKKAGVVYSNFFWYGQSDRVLRYGFTSQFTDAQKQNQLYRTAAQKFSHMRTFKISLFKEIDIKDLQDQTGNFYTIAADFAQMYPLLQLACGKVSWVDEFNYLYITGTGLNDYQTDQRRQMATGALIRSKPRYKCSKEFEGK